MRTRVLLAVLLVIGFGATARAAPDTIIFDDFSGTSLNTSLWVPFIAMGTGSVSVVDQHLAVFAGGGGAGGSAAVVALLGTIAGNFEVIVRYELSGLFDPLYETGAGILLSTPTYPFGFTVARDTVDDPNVCLDYGVRCNGYVGAFPYPAGAPSDEFKVRTIHESGELRFTRVGSYMAAWFWNSSDWTLIHGTTDFSPEPITALYLGVTTWGPDTVSVAFDDFRLQADQFTPIPEPASLLLLGTGLVGLARWRKRKQ